MVILTHIHYIGDLVPSLLFLFPSGTHIAVEEDEDNWTVLIVTPIMRRAQDLKEASEIIFTDSTSSCDSERSNVTVLMTATKAGAVPIAVLLHKNKSEEDYAAAYKLLVREFPKCFGKKEVRKICPIV